MYSHRLCTFILASIVLGSWFVPAPACGQPAGPGRASLDQLVEQRLQTAVERYRHTITVLHPEGGFPRSTRADGAWGTVPPSDWTSGFFPGILWQLYEYSGDPALGKAAPAWTAPLTAIFNGRPDHDLGFQFYCSFGQAYRITDDASYTKPLMQAAEVLAARFNPKTGLIKSWNWEDTTKFPVIADNMMNLELLLWASANGGRPEWKEVALTHARTTTKTHFRDDHGSFHVVVFNPATGQITEKITAQGYANTSTWARGQAWLVYGFTMMYRMTKDPAFLQTARDAADYFVGHLPADYVPYWDFQAPDIPNAKRDASAGAIATSALFELSTFVPGEDGQRYRETAEHLLAALASPAFFAQKSGSPNLLDHGVGHHPAGTEIDVALIYGDYYFIEAMRRYQQLRVSEKGK